MKGDRERCLQAGMDDYVGKPVRAQDLFDALARVVVDSGEPASPSTVHRPPSTTEIEAELLERVGGDRALLREVVSMFLETCPGSLAELREAVARADAAAVHRLAHTFKGMVAHFGAPAAVEAAQRLEDLGRAQDLGGAEEAFAALAGAAEALRPALGRLLDEGGPS
jgi:HPt (histidine-containing phosphotransfer) domain-containing protein